MLIRFRFTPAQARMAIDLGIVAKLSGDPPLDPFKPMSVVSDDLREILASVPLSQPGRTPAQGRTALSLRRRAKAALEKAERASR
jgi:hypothetical protein